MSDAKPPRHIVEVEKLWSSRCVGFTYFPSHSDSNVQHRGATGRDKDPDQEANGVEGAQDGEFNQLNLLERRPKATKMATNSTNVGRLD